MAFEGNYNLYKYGFDQIVIFEVRLSFKLLAHHICVSRLQNEMSWVLLIFTFFDKVVKIFLMKLLADVRIIFFCLIT